MSRLRGIAKLLLLAATNLVFFVFLVLTGFLLAGWNLIAGKKTGTGQWRTRVFHAWGRTMARLLGMRVRIDGKPPDAPFVLVSNHLGYVDVILLASALRCVFVSKADVKDLPLVGRLCTSVNGGISRVLPR